MTNIQNAEIIIWDWNGTLLNDVDHCIATMNRLLARRSLPQLIKNHYLEIFTFPVRDYYLKLGFDFSEEAFETPAEEFISNYNTGFSLVPLYPETKSILQFFSDLGKKQYILSAMEHGALVKSVDERGILEFFSNINGINDNLAHGKTDLAREIIIKEKIDPEKAILIGDTLHDAEVAREIGIANVLIAAGHQSRSRLEQTGNLVLGSLNELMIKYSR